MDPKRNYLKDTYHHLYNRGAHKATLFFDRGNYLYFTNQMKYYSNKFAIKILCYCLIPNHFHLFVQQTKEESTISKFISCLLNSYVKSINKKNQHSGTLFESKTKSKHVEDSEYCQWLIKYILENPVNAKLVKNIWDWEYSSAKDLINPHPGNLTDTKSIQAFFSSKESMLAFLNHKTSEVFKDLGGLEQEEVFKDLGGLEQEEVFIDLGGFENGMLTYRTLSPSDEPWINKFILEHWGSEKVVVHNTVYYPAKLNGFVVENEQKKIGLITYNIDKQSCEIVTLNSIVKNKGIGSELVKLVIDQAKEKGCSKVWLITTNDNTHAIHFYQKLGFRLTKVYSDAVNISRKIKPEIPLVSKNGIPIQDELEFILYI